MWSVGCILAELFGRKVFLPGSSGFEQLHLILQKLGTPDEETLNSIPSNKAKVYISKLPRYERISLSKRFPNTSSEGLDLLEKLLEFSPEKRITASEALNHPYLSNFNERNQAVKIENFDFSFDKTCTTLIELRSILDPFLILDAILQEINYYKPLNIYSEIIKSTNRSSGLDLDCQNQDVEIDNFKNNDEFCLKTAIPGHFSA